MNGRRAVPRSVLVVGASAAGLTTAEALRRRGYAGRLTILGAEHHVPYDRPPLSKQVLAGAWDPDRTRLRPHEALAALDAEFVLGDPATGLDAGTRTVSTAGGRTLRADALVIATGLRPRPLPGQPELAGVHMLRTLDDALALRADLADASRLVVVGDGVLGSEVAATARGLGLDVTLAGPQPLPMAAQFGPDAARLLAAVHTGNGVTLRLGSAVDGLEGDPAGRVTGVRLTCGEVLPADAVVVAVGALPNTEWLSGSGLPVDDGLLCDSRCRVADGIHATGDVARRRHPAPDGGSVRLENRTNATEQSIAVAGAVLGDDRPYHPVPYFWTDQFDARIQMYGTPSSAAGFEIVEGAPASGRFVALYREHGAVTGVLGWNMPKQARLRRQELVAARAAAPSPVP